MEMVCDKMKQSAAGAQTERRRDAGPVRDLLGGKASPAAFLLRSGLGRNAFRIVPATCQAKKPDLFHARRLWPLVEVRQLPQPHGAVLAAGHDATSVGAKGNAFSRSQVGLEVE
jgi:hypothetical protein